MAIKIAELVETIGKMPVIEVAELVKALEEKFGISAAMPVTAAPAAPVQAAAEPTEEKSEFKVTLSQSGPEKIKVIKALRSVTSLTLKQAKDLVESAPAVIAESASKQDAEKIKKELETAGGKVELS